MHHHHFSGFFGRKPHRDCAGRGRHRGFGGLFGGGHGHGEFGWHAFRAGRKLDADDLQLLILALLAEKAAHGYELIKALDERSGGFYSPSPGMVYPALTYLEELGYASVEAEGTRKLYQITETGRAHLTQNQSVVDTIFAQLKWVGEKMDHVRRAFSGEPEEADSGSLMWRELREARSELKAALVKKRGASAEEQRRVLDILKRAAKDIAGK
jgi:DNA-binding PadR family transcriptional regulator